MRLRGERCRGIGGGGRGTVNARSIYGKRDAKANFGGRGCDSPVVD